MMRSKIILSLLSAVFSFIFLIAGTGYNIIHYCCGACELKGIEYIAHHSCEDVHHNEDVNDCDSHHSHHCNHQKTSHTDFVVLNDIHADAETCHSGEHCDVKRVQVDDFSISQSASISNLDIDYQILTFIETIFNYQTDVVSITAYPANPPPDLCFSSGREILSSKAVLII